MVKNILILLLLAGILLARYHSIKPQFTNGQKIKITTTVLTQPIVYDHRQYLKLFGLKIYLPLYPEVSYGDKVQIIGIVKGDTLKNPQLTTLVPSKNIIIKIRQELLGVYTRTLPTDEAALVSGVVIGSKSTISSKFWDELKNSGTAHVVVASGMNVTLVAGFLLSFCVVYLKRRKAIIIVLVGIWIYALLCGLEAPIVRAAIMGTIAFLAQEAGRLNQAVRSLVLCAYIMLLVNPIWITDVGYILSFSATLSLLLFSRPIEKFGLKLKLVQYVPRVFRESLFTTISAQIGVVPVLYFSFGNYNPLSVVANALVLWTIPPLTIAGFVGGVLGLIYLPFGKLVLYVIYPLSEYFTSVVELF